MVERLPSGLLVLSWLSPSTDQMQKSIDSVWITWKDIRVVKVVDRVVWIRVVWIVILETTST